MIDCSLTADGRKMVEKIADCFVDVDIEERGSKQECRDIAGKHGLEMIGSGLGRDVFTVPHTYITREQECVLKVPTRLLGCYENRREVTYWNQLPDNARDYLAPVLDQGIGWILMPRAEQNLTSEEIVGVWNGLASAGYAVRDANWDHNLGRVNDKPVIIDYGEGCFRYDKSRKTVIEDEQGRHHSERSWNNKTQ